MICPYREPNGYEISGMKSRASLLTRPVPFTSSNSSFFGAYNFWAFRLDPPVPTGYLAVVHDMRPIESGRLPNTTADKPATG